MRKEDPKWRKVMSNDDLVRFGRASLVCFARWPLGMRGDYEPWNCQRTWMRMVQDAYLAKLRDPLNTPLGICILAPTNHGKTTSIALPFISWVLARNRNLRVIVAGSKDDLAVNVGQGIDRVFANRAEEMASFGLRVGYPWNTEEKYLIRDNEALIHPSILCVGPESEFQGKRADVIVCTDIFTFKNQRSPESRAKMMDWLYQTLFQRLEPGGFVVMEGHHVGASDGYTELEEAAEIDSVTERIPVHKFRAILEEPCEANGGQGRVLAPERWTYKALSARRAKKPGLFQVIYQNRPEETRGFVSRDVLDTCLDRSRGLVYGVTPELRAQYKSIVMCVDPAFSLKRQSSWSVCLVFGISASGQWDLLGGWRVKVLAHQLRQKLIASIAMFNPDEVYVEANAAQELLAHDLRQALGDRSGIIHSVFTLGAGDPENTPEQGLAGCVALCEGKMVTFPYQGGDAQELVDRLFLEIINFPGKGDDDVMMAWQIGVRGKSQRERKERKVLKVDMVGRVSRGWWRRWS